MEVSKGVRDGTTFARAAKLAGEARVEEIARMLGGTELTDRALAHAREMLERATRP